MFDSFGPKPIEGPTLTLTRWNLVLHRQDERVVVTIFDRRQDPEKFEPQGQRVATYDLNTFQSHEVRAPLRMALHCEAWTLTPPEVAAAQSGLAKLSNNLN